MTQIFTDTHRKQFSHIIQLVLYIENQDNLRLPRWIKYQKLFYLVKYTPYGIKSGCSTHPSLIPWCKLHYSTG